MNRALFASFALIGLLACGGGAPNTKSQEQPAHRGGRLIVAIRSDLDSWNPLTVQDAAAANLLRWLYPQLLHERLTERGLEWEPWLADPPSVEQGGTVLRFKLRRDAKWSDGTPVLCDNFRLTWEARNDQALAAPALRERVREITCPGTHQLEAHLTAASFDAWLAINNDPAVPKAYSELPFSEWGSADWKARLVTSGPFKVASIKPGQELVLQRDEHGAGPVANFDELVFRVYRDDALALSALLSGDIDFVERVPPQRAREVAERPDLQLIEGPSLAATEIVWNQLEPEAYSSDRTRRGCTGDKPCPETEEEIRKLQRARPHPVLADARVRRALSLALDRQDLIDGLLAGRGVVGATPIVSGLWAFDPESRLPHDLALANQLLDQAGWKERGADGIRTRGGKRLRIQALVNAESALKRDVLERCAAMLKLVGVELVPTPLPRGEFASRVFDKRFDAVIWGWRAGTSISTGLSTHEALARGPNVGSWSTPESDRLIKEAGQAPTQEEARRLWGQWQRICRDEQPVTVLYEERLLIGATKRLHDATPSALNPYDNLPAWWIEPRASH